MANGAARTGGGKSKPKGFAKESQNPRFNSVTVKPGDTKVILANIKQLASNYGKPSKATTIATDPKNYKKQMMDNLRMWGSSKGGQGDNPFKPGSK